MLFSLANIYGVCDPLFIILDFTFLGLANDIMGEAAILGVIGISIWTVLLLLLSRREEGLKVGFKNLFILALYLIPLIAILFNSEGFGGLFVLLAIYLLTTIHTIAFVFRTVGILTKENAFLNKTIPMTLGVIAVGLAMLFGYNYLGEYPGMKRDERISGNADLTPKPKPPNPQITHKLPEQKRVNKKQVIQETKNSKKWDKRKDVFSIYSSSFYKAVTGKYGKDKIDYFGKGIIGKNWEGLDMNIPDTCVIKFYKKPKGHVVGKLQMIRSPAQLLSEYNFLELDEEMQNIGKDYMADLLETGYEYSQLKYYGDNQDGYLQCFTNSIDGGLWVKSNELEQCGYKPKDWFTILTNSQGCYFPLKRTLVYDSTGQIVDTLSSDRVFQLTNESKKRYIKTEIYKPDGCGGCDELVGTGWIKFINENGHPTIWYHTRGC